MIINFYTNEESCYGFENKTQMVFVRKNEVTSEGNQKMLWSTIGSGSLLSPFLTDFSLYLNHFSNEMNILLWLLLSSLGLCIIAFLISCVFILITDRKNEKLFKASGQNCVLSQKGWSDIEKYESSNRLRLAMIWGGIILFMSILLPLGNFYLTHNDGLIFALIQTLIFGVAICFLLLYINRRATKNRRKVLSLHSSMIAYTTIERKKDEINTP